MAAACNGSGPARVLLACVLICAAASLAYSEKLFHPFQFDDEVFILGEPSIRGIENVPGFFIQDTHLLYRPLRQALYALTVHWAGFDAAKFHLIGFALHILCCLAVVPIGRRLSGSWRVGLLAGLLGALHPVRIDRVANITGSFDLLALALSLWGLALWLASLARGGASTLRRFFAVTLFAAGLLAGEEAAAVLVVAGLAAWWYGGDGTSAPSSASKSRAIAPLAVLLVAYLALRTAVLGLVGRPTASIEGPAAFWSFGLLFWRYVRLLLFPVRLSVAYPEEPMPPVEPWVLLGWAAMLVAVTAWLLWLRSARRASLLLFWGLLALAPFSQIFPSGTLFAERYLYHAVAPASIAAAWALVRMDDIGGIGRAASRLCLFAVLLCFIASTLGRVAVWRGPETLWSDAVAKQPGAYLARLNWGNSLRDSGRPEQAVEEFRSAVAMDPDDPRARVNLGNILYARGDVRAASVQFEAALYKDFDSTGARVGLANISVMQGDYNRALRLIGPVLDADPDNLAALLVLGYISSVKGEYALAIDVYGRALALSRDPEQVRVLGKNISNLQMKVDTTK